MAAESECRCSRRSEMVATASSEIHVSGVSVRGSEEDLIPLKEVWHTLTEVGDGERWK